MVHTPLRCLARLDLDWWCLLFFDQNRDSEMILPKYTILYMVLPAKELQGSWQKIWFDLEISRCTKTISFKVTFQPMDIVQWEDKQEKLPCHHCKWNTSQRWSWEPIKDLWRPLSMALMLAYIPIKTIEWIAMMKLKYYVENMVLLEDYKTPWWLDLNTLQLVQWFSPTSTKWKLLHQLPDLHHFLPWRAPATLADIQSQYTGLYTTGLKGRMTLTVDSRPPPRLEADVRVQSLRFTLLYLELKWSSKKVLVLWGVFA